MITYKIHFKSMVLKETERKLVTIIRKILFLKKGHSNNKNDISIVTIETGKYNTILHRATKCVYNSGFVVAIIMQQPSIIKTCGATRNPECPRTGPDRTETGPGSGNIFKNISGPGRVGEFYFGSVRVGEFYFGSVRVGVFFYRV